MDMWMQCAKYELSSTKEYKLSKNQKGNNKYDIQ